MVVFSIIKALILVFGFHSGQRIYVFLKEKYDFEKKNLKKSIMSIGFLTFFLVVALKMNLLETLFLFLAVFFCSGLAFLLMRRRREALFRQDFVDLLDRSLLFLRLGHSFRYSFDKANQKIRNSSQKRVQYIYDSVIYSRKISIQDPLDSEIFHLFDSIHTQPHKITEKMSSFRSMLKMQEKFRLKLSTIVRQVTIQVVFIIFLYSSLFIFITQQFPFSENRKVYLLSLILFILGIAAFCYLTQRRLWKI